MKCSNCGAELAEGAKFCGECGTKVVKAMFCPECGAKCAPGAKFCGECGHKLGIIDASSTTAIAETKQNVSAKYIDKNCFSTRQIALCEKIDDATVEELKEAAQNGDGDAIYVLSWYCMTKEDEGKEAALQGFQAGAAQGSAYCQFAVARNLWSGEGECEQAIEMYEKSAASVGVPAYWEIAMIIMEGYIDRPWQDALPYFKKIVETKGSSNWDPLLIDAASALADLLPKVEEGDAEAMVKIYRVLVDFEIANRKLGKDPWFGFGIRSITFGSSLGRILNTYEETVDGDDECMDEVVQGLLQYKDDENFGTDIEEAMDEGSVIAEKVLNRDDESSESKKEADEFFGLADSRHHDNDDDDEDEMLDDEEED